VTYSIKKLSINFHSSLKLLQSNRVCKGYSKSKVGRFLETQCMYAKMHQL